MPIKVLFDSCVPPFDLGPAFDVDAVHFWPEGDPKDPEILRRATAQGRILITADNDFEVKEVMGKGSPHPGVLRVPQFASLHGQRAAVLRGLERHLPLLQKGWCVFAGPNGFETIDPQRRPADPNLLTAAPRVLLHGDLPPRPCRRSGFDTSHTDHWRDMPDSPAGIVAEAFRRKRILVTTDPAIADAAHEAGGEHCGVLLLPARTDWNRRQDRMLEFLRRHMPELRRHAVILRYERPQLHTPLRLPEHQRRFTGAPGRHPPLILTEDISPRVLRQAGLDVDWAGDWPKKHRPEVLLHFAARDRAVLVTGDAELAALAAERRQRTILVDSAVAREDRGTAVLRVLNAGGPKAVLEVATLPPAQPLQRRRPQAAAPMPA